MHTTKGHMHKTNMRIKLSSLLDYQQAHRRNKIQNIATMRREEDQTTLTPSFIRHIQYIMDLLAKWKFDR